jgi:tRNA pseudouridine38-40 synthase
VNFHTHNTTLPVEKIPFTLNNILPGNIRVLEAFEAPPDFHSHFSAEAREYIYMVINAKPVFPLFNNYSHFVPEFLDIQKIKSACRLFNGTHNFKNFCVTYSGDMKYDRRIFYFRAVRIEHNRRPAVLFYVKGDGFLRGMIRTMVSVCLNHSLGKVSLDTIEKALNNEIHLSHGLRGQVPACGLYLKRGFYPPLSTRIA